MKREEKNALSRQRILDAALREFSEKGYDAASMNTICAENGISKGIIYHYFKDKDELYLLCITDCFEKLTAYLQEKSGRTADTIDRRLQIYFDARLHFFAEHVQYQGLFLTAVLNPPAHLSAAILRARQPFDELNAAILTDLLKNTILRAGLSVSAVVDYFQMYMDFFNARFQSALTEVQSPKQALHEHEERCHRQLDILLHGVIGC
jgi:TetR/AcrR family transcriptional regulator